MARFYIRDGAIVGYFPEAVEPMVWRFDLTRVHAAGFRVVQNGVKWDLVVESTRGEPTTIVSFHTQSKAKSALRKLMRTLKVSGWMKRLAMLFMVCAVLIVLALVGGITYTAFRIPAAVNGALAPVAEGNIGKPLSADQALRAPPPLNSPAQ